MPLYTAYWAGGLGNSSSDSVRVLVMASPIGVAPAEALSLMEIYPNPSTGNFTIVFAKDCVPAALDILDCNGRKVLSKLVSGNEAIEVSFPMVNPGIYFVRLLTSTGHTSLKRLLIF